MKYRTSVAFRTALEARLKAAQRDGVGLARLRKRVVFERVAIDIGFATKPVLEPEAIASSHLLDFADISPVCVPTVAIEQHVAEKLHAYTRTYAADTPSSRVKDLVDLVVIAHTTTIDTERLAHAIMDIFDRRATHPVPNAVPPPPNDWEPGWRKLAASVPADDDVHHGHATAASLLDPILNHELTSGTWDPDIGEWLEA